MLNDMNRRTRLKVTTCAVAVAVVLLLIPACGQIGPLYLPDTQTQSPTDSATTDSSISLDDDDVPQ